MSEVFLAVFLGLFLVRFGVEAGLTGINLLHALSSEAKPPPALEGKVDSATVAKSLEYTVAKLRFSLLEHVADGVLVLVLLLSGVLPWWQSTLTQNGLVGAHLFVLFLVGLAVAGGVFGLPFSLYRVFGLETRFGFNKMSFALWLKDRLKGLVLAGVVAIPFLYGVYFFMEGTGPIWWLWLFAFLAGFQALLLWIYPTFIAPLFNKFEPLTDENLKTRLEALAQKAGFKIRGLFLMDASRRSGHANAYFSGLLRPRIVLFDTLIKDLSPEQTEAVLAHEIGHYRLKHIHKSLVFSLFMMLVMLYVLSHLVGWPPLFQAFGFAQPSFHAALALVMLGGGAFTFPLSPISAWLSRRREYQADAYALDLVKEKDALGSALVELSEKNLAQLDPHPWYSSFYYSHPTLLQRLAAIGQRQ